MKRHLVIFSCLYLVSCGTQLSPTQREQNNSQLNQNSGVSIDRNAIYPQIDQVGFPVGDAIRIKFTGPINAAAVEDYMLYVSDTRDSFAYQTVRTWNAANDEVTLTRMINNQRIGWDMGVTHTIHVSPYLTDLHGEAVDPYEYDFRTEDISTQGGGVFHVLEVRPSSELIRHTDYIYIKFSQPVYPGIPTYTAGGACDSTHYAPNFQFWVVDTRDANGLLSVPALPTPEMCLLCSATGVCDTLRIRPVAGWPRPYSLVNFLYVRIVPLNNQPGLGLRSATNQSHRLTSTYSFFKAIPIGGF